MPGGCDIIIGSITKQSGGIGVNEAQSDNCPLHWVHVTAHTRPRCRDMQSPDHVLAKTAPQLSLTAGELVSG
ncbi:hypothetical protein J6590_029339 [Homalodisca vitripennis]|nr:hypothetical protein J6590_029339 [Homalodisca vitripennis]